jgi:hypothetical protein
MVADLLRLIFFKNQAFDALWKADRHLDRRRHSHLRDNADPVPTDWLERRQVLAAEYDRALWAVKEAGKG